MRPTQEQIDAVEAKAGVDESLVRGILSRVPPSWTFIRPFAGGGAFRRGNINVIFTVQNYELHGRWEPWIHISVSGSSRNSGPFLPDWEDMKRVKNDFVGQDRWGYQVFPAAKDYVNVNPHVLHIYARLEGEPALPDFTWGLGSI
jgi:hypothetical protein